MSASLLVMSVTPLQRRNVLLLLGIGVFAVVSVSAAMFVSLKRADDASQYTPPATQSGAFVPVLSAHTPSSDAKEVPVDAAITLIFSKPMVALTQVQGAAAATQWANWPVTIDPPLAGQWRWLSTYAAQFTPESGLVPGSLYTVTVPAGIPAVSGHRTEKEGTWRFETERPHLMSTDPQEGYGLAGPKTLITLTFNQEMNPQSVASHVRVFNTSKTGAPPAPTRTSTGMTTIQVVTVGSDVPIKAIRFGQTEVNSKKITDKKKIVIETASPLELHSQYRVELTPGVLGTRGDLGTVAASTLNFSTVPPLTVLSANFEYGSIQLNFSAPVARHEVVKNVSIEPRPIDWKDRSISIDDWSDSKHVSISAAYKPSTSYTLTVNTDFVDEYGQHLTAPYTFTFVTPPLSPEIAIAYSKGEFGIFERDRAPVYYFNAVNVSTASVSFAKLTMQEFITVRQQKTNNYQFAPDLKGKALYKALTLTMKKKQDQWETIAFDVSKRFGNSLKPGIYALLLRSPEYRDYNGQEIVLQQYFVITDTGLTLKYSGDKALVWATDLQTGEPVADAAITFHSVLGTTTVRGKTDSEGFFEAPIKISDFKNLPYDWQPEFWVTANRGDDFAFVGSNWNGGYNDSTAVPWRDFHSPMASPFRLFQQFITDRPVYRPGDKVGFKGVARLKDWSGILQLPGTSRTMQVTIQDPNGTEVYKKTLPFSEFGGFADSFATSETSALGSYTVLLQLLPESDVGGPAYVTGFSVLAYRKPEYKIDLTPSADDYKNGDTVTVDLTGAYYFGAPLGNAPVTWRVTLTDYYFNKYKDGWYSFSTEDVWCWYRCEEQSSTLTQGSGTLDATGKLRIRFPVSIDDKKVSQIATIEADVTDPNNQLVSNRISVPIHKSRVYVGVRNEDYAVAPGETAKIAVVTADPQGKALPNTTVTITLASRAWNTVRKKTVDGQFTYENDMIDTFVSTQSVTTGTDGKATAQILLPKGGGYAVTVEAEDDAGNIAKAGTSLYAWSSSYVNWPHENDNSIDVIADKPEYAVGDTAKLLVKSPFQGEGVKALVTVERENVITRKVVDVTSNALPIEIPITEDLIPNAFFSVVIVKPRMGETFDDQGKDTGVPAFRIGYAQLHVETTKKRLSVTVSTDKKQYLPGEKVTATVTSRDSSGKPVRGEFTLAAVDMSVLALAGFSMPDLVANFYAERGLGVETAQMLTFLIERFKPGSKGGGGGELADRKRGNFQDTAYWNPTLVTDDKGQATVTFTLPDNLTTWQLLALGSTKDNLFGGGDLEILETKNVILRPVRPRFAVRGDKITLGAIVHNFLPFPRSFTVSLEGTGFSVTGKASREVMIASGEETKVEFPVIVQDVTGLTLNMRAETDGARDEIEEKIPVYIFGTPQSVASTGQTSSLVTEKVLVPSEKDASSGHLDVTVSPSMATYLPGGLQYLVDYPYGCAEQVVSTFVPQLALKRLQKFDAFDIASESVLSANITTALQKLYRFQRSDGGFGYWEESRESFPYLTAYVLYGLTLAKDTGESVDSGVIKRAGDYLSQYLRTVSKNPTSIELAQRAYILFVLAETGKVDSNLLNNLYDQRQKLPVFSQAELTMAMQKAGMQKKAQTLLSHILDGAKIDPRGAHVEEPRENEYRWLMQDTIRTSAETLQAMVRIDPENVLLPQIIRFLLTTRKDGHWDTTQSTVQSILALVDYLKSSGELDGNFVAGVEVNDKMILTQRFDAKNILTRKEISLAFKDLLRGKENEVNIGMDGTGKLFYDLLLSYFYTGDVIEPAEQGISITRQLQPVDQKKMADLQSANLGETYRVTLTMTVPADRYFVAVESPLPGGLEAIDLQLKTNKQEGLPDDVRDQNTQPFWWYGDEEDNGLWRFNHREFRDDRVFLFADELPAGVYKYTYLVRATTPGTFRLRPAHIWEMYYPETFGQSSGEWFTVNK